jgi:hypothetical protein
MIREKLDSSKDSFEENISFKSLPSVISSTFSQNSTANNNNDNDNDNDNSINNEDNQNNYCTRVNISKISQI